MDMKSLPKCYTKSVIKKCTNVFNNFFTDFSNGEKFDFFKFEQEFENPISGCFLEIIKNGTAFSHFFTSIA